MNNQTKLQQARQYYTECHEFIAASRVRWLNTQCDNLITKLKAGKLEALRSVAKGAQARGYYSSKTHVGGVELSILKQVYSRVGSRNGGVEEWRLFIEAVVGSEYFNRR